MMVDLLITTMTSAHFLIAAADMNPSAEEPINRPRMNNCAQPALILASPDKSFNNLNSRAIPFAFLKTTSGLTLL
jgi:hypothetical protein